MKKFSLFVKRWNLKDCEKDIRKLELDFYAWVCNNKNYKAYTIWVGSSYFGALDINFVSNKKRYINIKKIDSDIGKQIF